MNKTLTLLFFIFSFCWTPQQAYSYTFISDIEIQVTQSDSLQIDKTPILKRQFENLSSKYNNSDFNYERPIEKAGWWSLFKQWLSNFFKNLFNFTDAGQASKFTETVLTIAAILLIVIVVFFIFKSIINKEGTWVFSKTGKKPLPKINAIEDDIENQNFSDLVNNAVNQDNYRLAIRYYYLWLLKTMNAHALISYDIEKTNSDYFYEINSEAVKSQFSYASYLYNYIWYGEFNVDENQFKKAQDAFSKFINAIDNE